MISFKELEEMLTNLIYSDDYQKYITKYEQMDNRYDKQKVLKGLITYFLLDPRFLEMSEILLKLSTNSANFRDIVSYVRSFAKKTSKENSWFLIGGKYDYNSKLLLSTFPRTFPDELTARLFCLTYPDETSFICKFIDDPKYILTGRSKELFDMLNNYESGKEEIVANKDTNYYYNCGRYITNNLVFTYDLTKKFSEILNQKFDCNEDHFCYSCKYKKNSFVLFDEIVNDPNRFEVDVLFMGMNPYKDEIALCRPFSGKAGKHLRNLISNSKLQYTNMVIFNTVPCFIENNADPTEDVVSRCATAFANECIRYLKPKVVVFLGDVALKGFYYMLKSKNVDDNTLKEISNKIRHSVIKLSNNMYVSHTYHPSYLNYNYKAETIEKIANQFNNIYSLLGIESSKNKYITFNNENNKSGSSKKYINKKKDVNIFLQSIYDDGYWPTNVVFLDENNPNSKYPIRRAIARFRNLSDPKDQFLVDISEQINFEYFTLKPEDNAYTTIKNIKDVIKKEVPFIDYINKKFVRDDLSKGNNYEADIDEYDYLMFKFGECVNYKEVTGLHKICFTDIEVLSESEVPDEKNCNYPIPMITSVFEDTVYVYLCYSVLVKYVNVSKNDFENYVKESFNELMESFKNDKIAGKFIDNNLKLKVVLFNDESELLINIIKLWSNADVLTGWNSFYDLNYVAARAKLFGIDRLKLEDFSTNKLMYKKYNQLQKDVTYIPHRSYRYGFYQLPGMTMIDMLDVYKSNHKLESYSLDFVSKLEFDTVSKMHIEGSFINQLKTDTKSFIKYNINDTMLTYLIENKNKLIQPLIGLSSISFCTLTTVSQSLKLIDGFLVKYARKNGCVIRNKRPYKEEFQKVGGYVRPVSNEQNELVVCFDVASMYPNIIISYNVSFDSYIGHIKGQFIDNEERILTIVDNVSYFVNKIKNSKPITDEDKVKNLSFTFVFDPYYLNKEKELTCLDLAKFIIDKELLITPRGTVFRNKPDGLAVQMMKDLLQQRKGYKKKAAETGDPVAELFSQSYKIAANSFYGANGAVDFRFFNPYNAETITLIGQMIIKTVQLATEDFVAKEMNMG